mmetsp:Transcript_168782/g.542464  ORF Transcript_168782/g.542464 Transcript_168782/m.542464 type:complete len:295 (+) Transcript_168782:1117-2001(+)
MPSQMVFSMASRPSAQQASTMREEPEASIMRSFQAVSIISNRLESSGSCARMSSDCMKMGSRRHQLAWTFCQTLSAPSMALSLPLHSSTSGLQNSMKRPCDVMPIISRASPSRRSRISPSSPSRGQSGLDMSKVTGILDQTFWMILSFLSIFASLADWSTISETSSANSCSDRSVRSLKQNSGPFSKDFWVTVMSCVQWRSRMVSPWRSLTSGSTVPMFLTSSCNHLYNRHERTGFGMFLTWAWMSREESSKVSVSILSHRMVFQLSKVVLTRTVPSHRFFKWTNSSEHSLSSR